MARNGLRLCIAMQVLLCSLIIFHLLHLLTKNIEHPLKLSNGPTYFFNPCTSLQSNVVLGRSHVSDDFQYSDGFFLHINIRLTQDVADQVLISAFRTNFYFGMVLVKIYFVMSMCILTNIYGLLVISVPCSHTTTLLKGLRS